jgi:succinate-semialdehyde dehydrogenase / glutarate-semialdehyde dehydrogenase
MGKLFHEAQGEVDLSADILDSTRTTPRNSWRVIFCMEPWNFPYYQLARVAGPNLMVGNTLIVKHAPNVPQCALAFERLFLDAGLPAGAYTDVFISNEQSAQAIADKRIKGVALTGSERAGAGVASEAGKALKKSTMELGGSEVPN